MEQLGVNAHLTEIVADMRSLAEKYRAIFGWGILEIEQRAADALKLATIHTALDDLAAQLSG